MRHVRESSGVVTALCITLFACTTASQDFDVVISGGRVIDPESGLDAERDIGIRQSTIAEISEGSLMDELRDGGTLIDATGLVVAPGFIDLHAHGQSNEATRYRVRDGVTTALELEAGYSYVDDFLSSRQGKARIHYGASVSHRVVRGLVQPELAARNESVRATLREVARADEPLAMLRELERSELGEANYRDVPEEVIGALKQELQRGLYEGAIGIGMAHAYYPGASRREILRVFQFAGNLQAPIFVHARSRGLPAVQEVIANAAATGAPLHIVHVNSTSIGELPEVLELIQGARERGLNVTTEAYPYTAGSTFLQSALFDEGWQETFGISYGDLQWQDTGERLSEETFERYRSLGGAVIMHYQQEEMIELAMRTPFVMVASDAMPYAPGAHPRSAGTFARVLGRYVRERRVLDLSLALGKMALLPAQRLEDIAPAMRSKGRLQVDADADSVVFDPERVIDTATYEDGLSYSTGITHVLVAGTPVVRDSEIVEAAFPGKPIRGRYWRAGQ